MKKTSFYFNAREGEGRRPLISRLFPALLALLLAFGVLPAGALAQDTVTVIVDFEGYNLGQGFYVEPTRLTLPAGSTAGEATDMLLSQTGHAYAHGGTPTSGYYVSRVQGFGGGAAADPPQYVLDWLDDHDDELDDTGSADGSLGDGDWYFMSGWMYTVNHVLPNEAASAVVLQDGDVIRWQFTLILGLDLGVEVPVEYGTKLYSQADKTALARALFAEGADDAARQAALRLIIDPRADARDVSDATAALLQGGAERPRLTGLTAEGLDASGLSFDPNVFQYDVRTAATGTASFSLTAAFDEGAFTLAAGAETLASGVPRAFPVSPGLNAVALRLESKDDPAVHSDYLVNILRPQAATLKSLSLTADVPMADAPLVNNFAEGALWKAPGGVLGTRNFAAATKEYRLFYLSDARTVTLNAAASQDGSHVKVIAGGLAIEGAGGVSGVEIPLAEDATALRVEVCSAGTYAQNGGFLAEDAYTVSVEKPSISQAELDAVKIKTLALSGGELRRPFASEAYGAPIFVKASEGASVTYALTAEPGTDVYISAATTNPSNKLTPTDGVCTYTKTGVAYPTAPEMASGYQTIFSSERIIKGLPIKYQYKIFYMADLHGAPDEVTGYMVPASQYANSAMYGLNPDFILGGTMKSLGNFGGYVTVRYDEPIKNDPNHPYGVDFIVAGNSGGASFSEPGNVYVSKDGSAWFLLAGSDYFDDNTIRDYEVTYVRNADGTSGWRDNKGNADPAPGSLYKYPNKASYPLYPWKAGEETEISFRGPLLTASGTDPYGSTAAAYPDWGYADVHSGSSLSAAATNPYSGQSGNFDVFDISWAIDARGAPVSLDEISYIKVQTASHIYAGAIGEKSTEVAAIIAADGAEGPVGTSRPPAAIKVNGEPIPLRDGEYSYAVELADDDVLLVEVEGAEGGNVYINNRRGSSRSFAAAPRSGVVRVLTQEAAKEPLIYYIRLDSPSASPVGHEAEMEGALAYLLAANPAPGFGAEWAVLALARAGGSHRAEAALPAEISGLEAPLGGAEPPEGYFDGYYARVAAFVEDNGSATLDDRKSTENSRLALALSALGADARDVGGRNLLEPLASLSYVAAQGINGPIHALLALDARGYPVPQPSGAEEQATREKLAQYVLDREIGKGTEDAGGFSLMGGAPDPDITSMALAALAPYKDSSAAAGAAIERGLAALSGIQSEDGGFAAWGGANAESCAQAVIALSSLGIDAQRDPRFVRRGGNPLSALLRFRADDGGFRHMPSDAGSDGMATEQAAMALVAYDRLVNGRDALYAMADASGLLQPQNPTVDKRSLEAAIALAETKKAADWTASSWNAMQNSLGTAKTLAAKADASQTQVDAAAGALNAAITALVPASGSSGGGSRSIIVSFRLIGDGKHDGGVAGHDKYVTWIATKRYSFSGDSVSIYELLVTALSDAGLSQTGAESNYVKRIKAPASLGGYWLGELDNGPNSGWMFTINGVHAGRGLKDYYAQDGDSVIWHYTDDFTRETNFDGNQPDFPNRWLEASDVNPPASPAPGTGLGSDADAAKTKTPTDAAVKGPAVSASTAAISFDDVRDTDWFAEAVGYMASRGLMNGVGGGRFDPNGELTRAMPAVILFRNEGEPETTGAAVFSDVRRGDWHEGAVAWASATGVIQGYGDGLFGAGDPVSREQLAVMLYRYARAKGIDVDARADLSAYADGGQVSEWAREAMSWAVACGLVTGRAGVGLAPRGGASRAEAATLLTRFLKKLEDAA